jgi:hypothetical protein
MSDANRDNLTDKEKIDRAARHEEVRKFVLGRCLHRQVGWLLALEDTIDVSRRFTVLIQPPFSDS